jgi:hypothetical protein
MLSEQLQFHRILSSLSFVRPYHVRKMGYGVPCGIKQADSPGKRDETVSGTLGRAAS